jgi:hypothetical protein
MKEPDDNILSNISGYLSHHFKFSGKRLKNDGREESITDQVRAEAFI